MESEQEGYEVRISNSKKGKGLYATKMYERGEIILEEEPLVSCQFAWNTAYGYLACEYCMRPLESAEQNVRRLACKPDIVLPYSENFEPTFSRLTCCPQCSVAYCSEGCRQDAFAKYHQTLCFDFRDVQHPIVVLMEAWKQMHYPPETTNIMLLVRILAYIKQSADPAAASSQVKQFCHRTENEDAQLVHKLLGDQFADQLNTLRQLVTAVISGEEIEEFLTPEGFCTLMALIGTNGQGIGTSPLSMWVSAVLEIQMPDEERKQLEIFIGNLYDTVEKEAGAFLNAEGSGLFLLQSTCNHSCMPNAECSFPLSNHKVLMKATKRIAPGEEISISYLDDCTVLRSRHSRQKELAENYLFVCWCERCLEQADDPDCTSEEEMSEDELDSDD